MPEREKQRLNVRLYALHIHHDRHPWNYAPAWGVELGAMLAHTIEQNRRILQMSATMLQKADETLTSVTDARAAVDALIIFVTNAIRETTDDPAVINKLNEIQQNAVGIREAALAGTGVTPSPKP